MVNQNGMEPSIGWCHSGFDVRIMCILVLFLELSVLWRREVLCGAVNVVEVGFWGLWGFW